MMTLLATVALSSACAVLPAQKAKPQPSPAAPGVPTILGPGRYYSRDLPTLEGEWWALSKSGQGWELRPATLTAVPIAMAGDRKDRRSGMDIAVKGDEASLLLRHVPGVSAFRNVVAATGLTTVGETITDQRASGRLRAEPFTVWSEPASLGRVQGYVVKMETGGLEQVLFLNPACDACGWELMWGGDLDGDGKVDLLVATTDQKSYGTLRLFLSAAAEPGQALQQVASQRWVFGD